MSTNVITVITNLIETIELSDTSTGCCCCGEDMERHSDPMYCGHSPVDQGEYIAAGVIEEARALLKTLQDDDL